MANPVCNTSIKIIEDIVDDNDEDTAVDNEVKNITNMSEDRDFLEIKTELHPELKREVTRHKFRGIDVVVMPATPRGSPVLGFKPKVTEKPEDLDLLIGETALFKLTVADEPGVHVSWSKDGQVLFGSGRIKIWSKENSFFLQISQVEASDESLYECRVKNEHSDVVVDVQLLISEEDDEDEDENEDEEEQQCNDDQKINETKIKILKRLDKQYVIMEGDDLTLEVKTEGVKPQTVSWYYDGQKLLSSDDIKITSCKNNHKLKIFDSMLDDEGRYKCVVTDGTESDFTETEIFVDERD